MTKKEHIDKKGWVLYKNVFTPDEIKAIRKKALVNSDNSTDLLSNKLLKDVLLDSRVTDIYAELLDVKELVYYGDSTFTTNIKGDGFHKDSRVRFNRKSDEWNGKEYSLIRMAIYLQDHSKHSGGISLREGSHFYPDLNKGKIKNIRTEIGDVVLWKMTTTHSANAWIFKWFPNYFLSPRIMRRLPKFLMQSVEKPRIALFVTFGKNDHYMHNLIDYLKTRKCALTRWYNSKYDSTQIEDFKKNNVTVLIPSDEELKSIPESSISIPHKEPLD